MAIFPLQGYRIVDLGAEIVGGLTGRLLADMGAEVIKVESRMRTDGLRMGPENVSRHLEKDPQFHNVNRSKLGITVNFKDPRGAELIKALVKLSDVVTENWAPGVLAKYDLNYASLREVKPNIVMISMPAAGQYGPLSNIKTYGPSLGGLSGIDALAGYYDERPLGTQGFYGDWNSPVHGAVAILAALRYRNRTGHSVYIDMAQWETSIGCLGEAVMDYIMNERMLAPQGNRHRTMAPHGIYRCRGEDKWVSIVVANEDEWKCFCGALGEPAWAMEERFRDIFTRLHNVEALDDLINQWTAEHTADEVTDILQNAGVAATPVVDVGEAYFHPHHRSREAFVEIEHEVTGVDIVGGVPWRLSQTPGKVRRAAPIMGEHNGYVFEELLKLTKEEIAHLESERVIY